jgi:hypothetical protein
MWPFSEMSLAAASLVGTIANWMLLASLIGGVLSTFVIVKASDVKEEHWAQDRRISNERIATLNHDTARLQADNLALQTALQPRHVGIIGFDGPPKAETWFSGMEAFRSTSFVIQPTDDHEARNLANEIAIALAFFGVRATVDENATGLKTPQFPEGISVSYPAGKPWTEKEPNQPWFEWAKAANALAEALTKAGLGVGAATVSRYGYTLATPEDAAKLPFKVVREGVLVTVGQRPVSQTIAWIKQGRPDRLGNKAADATPAEPNK